MAMADVVIHLAGENRPNDVADFISNNIDGLFGLRIITTNNIVKLLRKLYNYTGEKTFSFRVVKILATSLV